MVTADTTLTEEKTRAEIAKLAAETACLDVERSEQVKAEIAKLVAETAKINAEARWYPFVATAGLFAAALAFLKLMDVVMR